eukprot:4416608-Prymnesium_polylepis.1
MSDAKTQTSWFRPVNLAVQYSPRGMDIKDMARALDSAPMRSFLAAIREGYEEALQQNETIDIFQVGRRAALWWHRCSGARGWWWWARRGVVGVVQRGANRKGGSGGTGNDVLRRPP